MFGIKRFFPPPSFFFWSFSNSSEGFSSDRSFLRWGKGPCGSQAVASQLCSLFALAESSCDGSWVQAQAGRGPRLNSCLLEPWLETWMGPKAKPAPAKSELWACGGEEERPFRNIKTPRIGKIKPKDLAGQVVLAKNKRLALKANHLTPLTNKKSLLKTKCKDSF